MSVGTDGVGDVLQIEELPGTKPSGEFERRGQRERDIHWEYVGWTCI